MLSRPNDAEAANKLALIMRKPCSLGCIKAWMRAAALGSLGVRCRLHASFLALAFLDAAQAEIAIS